MTYYSKKPALTVEQTNKLLNIIETLKNDNKKSMKINNKMFNFKGCHNWGYTPENKGIKRNLEDMQKIYNARHRAFTDIYNLVSYETVENFDYLYKYEDGTMAREYSFYTKKEFKEWIYYYLDMAFENFYFVNEKPIPCYCDSDTILRFNCLEKLAQKKYNAIKQVLDNFFEEIETKKKQKKETKKEKEFLKMSKTLKQIATEKNVKVEELRKEIKAGNLKAVKVGRVYKVEQTEIDRYFGNTQIEIGIENLEEKETVKEEIKPAVKVAKEVKKPAAAPKKEVKKVEDKNLVEFKKESDAIDTAIKEVKALVNNPACNLMEINNRLSKIEKAQENYKRRINSYENKLNDSLKDLKTEYINLIDVLNDEVNANRYDSIQTDKKVAGIEKEIADLKEDIEILKAPKQPLQDKLKAGIKNYFKQAKDELIEGVNELKIVKGVKAGIKKLKATREENRRHKQALKNIWANL